MNPITLSLISCVVFVTALTNSALGQDVNTSPGKQSVFISVDVDAYTLDLPDQIFPTAVIEKGKKGHVLVVTATVFVFGFEDKWIRMFPVVNNYFLQPPFSQGFGACPSSESSTCAGTGTWVADLDQLEAIAPGTFIGQPLDIQFFASDNEATGTDRSVSGTLIVRMEKKK